MEIHKKIIYIFSILLVYILLTGSSWNYLTKGRADNLYCSIDDCDSSSSNNVQSSSNTKFVDFSNSLYDYVYINMSNLNYNVTEYVNVGTEYIYTNFYIYE